MRTEVDVVSDAHKKYGVDRWIGGVLTHADEAVAEEVPVALVYNGISHAVMMATPLHLEDFALGFSLSECIIGRPAEMLDLEVCERANGIEVRMELSGERAQALKEHRRSLAGRTGCGLCGSESLEQLSRLRPGAGAVRSNAVLAEGALARAAASLRAQQPLFHLTGAVHAAAWCDFSGNVEFLREDVGRHNALDKLIGALAGQRRSFDDGFVLMTSRASYEIVQKAAVAGIAVVAAISAPTGMAVRVANEAGVTLIGFARGENLCVYSHPERIH